MTPEGVRSDPAPTSDAEEARARVERAERRAAFLADVGAVLASSLDYEITLATAARLAVPELADFCMVDVLEPGSGLRRVATAHRDSAHEELLGLSRQHPPDIARSPLARPMHTGEPALLPALTAEDLADIAPADEDRQALSELGVRALLALPLVAHGNRLGVLTLGMAGSGRSFEPGELSVALELARRVALAVENAALYRASQQAVRARERVLSIVSHDLRNPLGTIRTSALVLASATLDVTRRDKQAGVIVRAVERMERLIQDLLDLARIDAGRGLALELRLLDVREVLAEVVEVGRSRAEAKLIDLRQELPDELPHVPADRDRLFQVLGNLLSNAIKFTPEGGTVRVAATVAPPSLRIEVSDTGPGIDPVEGARVFDPYWQVTRTASLGTGLGLPIAKALVEAHGGDLAFESTPGVGSTFYFTLPLPGD